ncbi:CDK regulator involved in ribosome export [Paragonimus heterotremus]|uniref:CDK regulator involved in ribosome export n=1 Tax=Paragonimus heterotremus TaxID=100268 RepID=A0A8J4TK48_9TREM|nr:CDK regulator involved in ribosome export [Paragonimus heterotremus]
MPKKVARKEDFDPPTLELDLEGFSPSKGDCDGIAVLLKHIFAGSSVNAVDLAEYVVSNNACGTVVKPSADDDDEPGSDDDDDQQIIFSLTTVINLSSAESQKHSIIGHLKEFLKTIVAKAKPSTAKDNVLGYLDSESIHLCLFLNERFENLPLSVCADAVAALPAEMKEANLSPTHLVLLSRAHKSVSDCKLEYAYPEIEHVLPFSVANVEVTTKTGCDEDDSDFNTYVILILPMDKFSEVLDAMRRHL